VPPIPPFDATNLTSAPPLWQHRTDMRPFIRAEPRCRPSPRRDAGSENGRYVVCALLVLGPGPIGLLAVQLCKAMGAERVILSGTRDGRLEIGRKLGADHIINVRREDLGARVSEYTNGKGADAVLECAGA
jgi:threonine dehydrogenase-like Zn-dependent dehydrogenase